MKIYIYNNDNLGGRRQKADIKREMKREEELEGKSEKIIQRGGGSRKIASRKKEKRKRKKQDKKKEEGGVRRQI